MLSSSGSAESSAVVSVLGAISPSMRSSSMLSSSGSAESSAVVSVLGAISPAIRSSSILSSSGLSSPSGLSGRREPGEPKALASGKTKKLCWHLAHLT